MSQDMPMGPTAGRELVEVYMGLLIDAGISTPSSIVEADAGTGVRNQGCGVEDPGSKGADDWLPQEPMTASRLSDHDLPW
jgi:hypothetical protein